MYRNTETLATKDDIKRNLKRLLFERKEINKLLKNSQEDIFLLKEKLKLDKSIIECAEFLELNVKVKENDELHSLDVDLVNNIPSNTDLKEELSESSMFDDSLNKKVKTTQIDAIISDQFDKLPKNIDELKKRIPSYSLIALLSGAAMANPAFTSVVALTVAAEFKVYNTTFKNKKSTLFGINKKNYVTQNALTTSHLIKNMFNDKKSETFSVELVNLLLDLEENQEYNTISQSIVRASLRKLQKEGYITNYIEELHELNGLESKLVHASINLGMGNYDNLLKESKKYKMKFTRTEKEIDLDLINQFLNKPGNEIPHEIEYDGDKIDKVVYEPKTR
ncbi:MAG: hypothetical protein R3Y13_04610 [bacterium]